MLTRTAIALGNVCGARGSAWLDSTVRSGSLRENGIVLAALGAFAVLGFLPSAAASNRFSFSLLAWRSLLPVVVLHLQMMG